MSDQICSECRFNVVSKQKGNIIFCIFDEKEEDITTFNGCNQFSQRIYDTEEDVEKIKKVEKELKKEIEDVLGINWSEKEQNLIDSIKHVKWTVSGWRTVEPIGIDPFADEFFKKMSKKNLFFRLCHQNTLCMYNEKYPTISFCRWCWKQRIRKFLKMKYVTPQDYAKRKEKNEEYMKDFVYGKGWRKV